MAETKKKNEKRKKKENRFYFKETYLKVFETQIYYPQFVPKSNTDQQKKNPQKELFPHRLSFFFKKQRKRTHACISQGGGGLGKTPGRGVEVVWAKPQAEVQRWSGRNPKQWCRGGLGETPGGGAEVVDDEEGGGGLGSGRHHFGDGFCRRKMRLTEKKWLLVWFILYR
jgi:hypothetical protein